MYCKTFQRCPGFVDCMPCPYNAYNNKTCVRHINDLFLFTKKRKRLYSWIEEGKKTIDSTCCMCNEPMFCMPQNLGSCKTHAYCLACVEYCDNSCPMCLSAVNFG